jgi:hypothetical protein
LWARHLAVRGGVQNQVHLGEGEPRSLHLEIQIDEGLQLGREEFLIPACVQGQLVVGEHVSLAIGGAQMRQPYRRNVGHADELCCRHPAMAGQDGIVVVNEDRVGEAEVLDALRQLSDLALGVGASIAAVGAELRNGPLFDVADGSVR